VEAVADHRGSRKGDHAVSERDERSASTLREDFEATSFSIGVNDGEAHHASVEVDDSSGVPGCDGGTGEHRRTE
jgi:hypothetical protein